MIGEHARIALESNDLLRPKEVVKLVAKRLSNRFTMYVHSCSWKHDKSALR